MKRSQNVILLCILAVLAVLFAVSCDVAYADDEASFDTDVNGAEYLDYKHLSPTGPPLDEVKCVLIYVNGKTYALADLETSQLYPFSHFSYYGDIAYDSKYSIPKEELHSSRLAAGVKVYVSKTHTDAIWFSYNGIRYLAVTEADPERYAPTE